MKDEKERVSMPPKGVFLCKFVLVEHNKNVLLRVDSDLVPSHKDIVSGLEEVEGIVGKVLGGGWLEVLPDERIISAHGTSQEYGTADSKLVKDILQEYADWKGYYKVRVNMG